MATEDGAVSKVEVMRNSTASGVDDHLLHDTVLLCGVECLVAIVNEDSNFRMFGEDQMRCLGGIQNHIGGIHQEQLVAEPGSG